jgi:hypothetical protein
MLDGKGDRTNDPQQQSAQSGRVVTDFGSGHSEAGLSRAPIAPPPAGFDSFDDDIPF